MGAVSSRSKRGKANRLREGVRVHDVFEARASDQTGRLSGVVAVLDAFPYRYPRRFVGKAVRIVSGPGEGVRAIIDETRNHNTTISFFFKGLSRQDVPPGALIVLED